jgi:hypothetical protein
MNFFQFAGENPVLTLLVLYMLSRFLFRCWNRLMRTINIRKHGWPPPHCDADGDFKPEPEES